jgi:hypothetical protein
LSELSQVDLAVQDLLQGAMAEAEAVLDLARGQAERGAEGPSWLVYPIALPLRQSLFM